MISSGETHSVRELCELAFGHVGLDYTDYVVQDERFFRPAEVDLLVGDAAKARTVLGWEPKTSLPRLVQMMVDADLDAARLRRVVITTLAGGVGAARLLAGLVQVVDPAELVAVVNTGDDLVLHGLEISPDLDTVTYTLAGAIDPERGWGLAGETWQAMETLRRYGGEAWFNLGDRDLGTHLYRTARRRDGRHPDRGHRRDRRRLGPRAAAAAGDRRPAAHPGHRPAERRARSRSRSTSSAASTRCR